MNKGPSSREEPGESSRGTNPRGSTSSRRVGAEQIEGDNATALLDAAIVARIAVRI